jgi:hypothetical protein
VPVIKFIADDNVVELMSPPQKVTINGSDVKLVKPVVMSVTEIGLFVAPIGTVTVSDVLLEEITSAFIAPKNTTLLLTNELKFIPVIVTVVLVVPSFGENELIIGCDKALKSRTRKNKNS